MLQFPENFLHYIWKLRLFNLQNLKTTDGEIIEINNVGQHNHLSGPDFSNARIKIAGTLWAGNVEIHKKSSDWMLHGHQNDKNYHTVILHVVFEDDKPVYRPTGEAIPTLVLKNRIAKSVVQRYWTLFNSQHWIACQALFDDVPSITKNLWLDRLVVDRLEEKTQIIGAKLQANKQNWEQTFFQYIARSFGGRVNSSPAESLACSLPLRILAKHKTKLLQLEALLFGQAGLLAGEFKDSYPQQLQKEYQFLQKKYKLQPLKGQSWQFGRTRPANYPTIRLAQLAQLIHQSSQLFSKVLAAKSLEALQSLFDIKLSGYWLTHYRFDGNVNKRNKTLGKNSLQSILINTIAPFLFVYGKSKDDASYKDRALELLESLAPEQNSVIEKWEALGLEADNAYRTQALLQLKNKYCAKKRCLECAIGHKLLNAKKLGLNKV